MFYHPVVGSQMWLRHTKTNILCCWDYHIRIIFVWSTIPFLALTICFFFFHSTKTQNITKPIFHLQKLPFLLVQACHFWPFKAPFLRRVARWPEAGHARSGSGCTFKWSRQFAGPLDDGCSERSEVQVNGYGSIPINTIFRRMNIHLPAILMFTRGTRFWHTAR